VYCIINSMTSINPLNAELNPICHLLALLGAHLILHVGKIRVNVICGINYEGQNDFHHFRMQDNI